MTAPGDGGRRVVVLADDLIWGTRLADGIRRAGATAVAARSAGAFEAALAEAAGAIVDLTARAYDGLAALRAASAAGVPVVALAQHDDGPMRTAARAAGARRVYPYRMLFEHGERELGAFLASLGDGDGGRPIEDQEEAR